jgi:hypothetical protein
MESLLFNTSLEQEVAPVEPLTFVLGCDHGGHWIVQETHGLCGGLFADRDTAIRYARSECGERDATVRFSPDEIELKYSP